VPRSFHASVAKGGWSGFGCKEKRPVEHSALREALLGEQLSALSPGVAVTILAHIDLGIMGFSLFGSETLIPSLRGTENRSQVLKSSYVWGTQRALPEATSPVSERALSRLTWGGC
jgi:hypothetical protein